jgi:hypothetical protein
VEEEVRLWFPLAGAEHVLDHCSVSDIRDIKQVFIDRDKYPRKVEITEVNCDGMVLSQFSRGRGWF